MQLSVFRHTDRKLLRNQAQRVPRLASYSILTTFARHPKETRMKQLAELVPILLFFAVYKMDGTQLQFGPIDYQFDGIYTATAVLMLATIAQVAIAQFRR